MRTRARVCVFYVYIVSQCTYSTYCDYNYMDPGVTTTLNILEVLAQN